MDFKNLLTPDRQNLPIEQCTTALDRLRVAGATREGPMSIVDLPALSALRTKMKWHQARQKVLAENVANANTPGYGAKDIAPMKVDVRGGGAAVAGDVRGPRVTLARTSAAHMTAPSRGNTGFRVRGAASWEITPSGNGVVLEEQMMRLTTNQMDYQMATTLYSRSIALFKIALGK